MSWIIDDPKLDSAQDFLEVITQAYDFFFFFNANRNRGIVKVIPLVWIMYILSVI